MIELHREGIGQLNLKSDEASLSNTCFINKAGVWEYSYNTYLTLLRAFSGQYSNKLFKVLKESRGINSVWLYRGYRGHIND
jgi:hypothetical protein